MVATLKRFKFLKAEIMVFLFLFTQQAFAAGGLVKIYPQEVMLGERVTLVLNGDQALRDFDQLDLTELEQSFAIHEIDVSSEQIRLRLYPISTGLLTIPKISFGAIHIPSTPINVKPNPEVSIRWQSPKSEVYLGENLVWKAKVELKSSANRASFEGRKNNGWQIELQSQAVIEKRNDSDAIFSKNDVFVANYQFLTSNLSITNQVQTIQSPAVIVKNTTNRLWLFFDSIKTVNVKPLPQFLPMNITVGKVGLINSTEGLFKVAGDLNYWVWHLKGEGVDAFALENLAHQLIGQMSHNEQIEWLSESRDSTSQLTDQGLNSELTVRLPYRILQPGLFTLPELTVRYFDVETGKLVNQTLKSSYLMALPIWLVWIGQWLILIIGFAFLYAVLWKTKQVWLVWKLRQAILKAESTEQLISAMFNLQIKHCEQRSLKIFLKWKSNKFQKVDVNKLSRPASLNQFKQQFETQFGDSERLSQLIQNLNERLYASNSNQEQSWQEIERLAKAWAADIALW